MYQDFYLRFTNEAEANAVLYTAHPAVTDEEGNETAPAYTMPNYANIDVIGTIYEPQIDESTPPVALDGWHVNVLLMDDEDETPILPFETVPSNPIRKWAAIEQIVVVPSSVTRRQARQALLLAGLLDGIQGAINNITDPVKRGLVQIEWDDSLEFHRDRETLIMLAQAIGLDDEQLDNLFIQASKL